MDTPPPFEGRYRDQILAALHALSGSDERAGAAPAEQDPVVRAALACVTALRARRAALLAGPPRKSTDPLPAFEFHERPTMAMPAVGPASGPAAVPSPVAPEVTRRWGKVEHALYEDAVTLFDLGDQQGGMISVERLLMLSPDAKETETFLSKSERVFTQMYEDHVGSLDRIPVPVQSAHPIKIPASDASLVMDVLRRVDGRRSIREVIRLAGKGHLRGLITLVHLARSGFIELA